MLQKELKRLRLIHGLTQKELAEKLNITQHALSQYETNNREVSISMFESFLKVLNIRFKLSLSDTQKQSSAIASFFFDIWEQMESKFPGWNVIASGGGIWILEKEFYSDKLEQNVVVRVSDECAIVFKKITNDYQVHQPIEYIDKAEYDSDEKYEEYACESEELLYHYNSDTKWYKNMPIAEKIFNNDILSDLHEVSNLLI